MKYRRRAHQVEAEPFDGFPETIARLQLVPAAKAGNAWVVLKTGEKKRVVPGDWLVVNSDGDLDAFSLEEFQYLFEKAPEVPE